MTEREASDPPPWGPELERTWSDLLSTGGELAADPSASVRPRATDPDDVATVTLASEEASSFGPRSAEARETAATRPAARHRVISLARDEGGGAELVFEAPIGVGAMGEVMAARQRSLDRSVAVKLMREGVGTDQLALRQFESEAIIAGRLDHPNIIAVHDLGVDERGRLVYFMKRVEGIAWSRLIHARSTQSTAANLSMTGRSTGSRSGRGTHSIRDHIEILLAVCDAVAFAHSRGYIHRDLKPDNVIVGAYGEVQLIDWGLAASVRSPGPQDAAVAHIDQVLVTCGTPAYMPPETARGDRARTGTASDVYTLGAILFEILYGRRLHRGTTVMDVVRAAGRNGWSVPASIPGEARPYDATLRPLLERSLSTDPARRPPDGAAFAVALREQLQRVDAATQATQAYRSLRNLRSESYDPGDTLLLPPPVTPEARRRVLARIIARLETALLAWPDHPEVRGWLAEAHLEHGRIALDAGDLGDAGATLDDLRELPGEARLSDALEARIAALRDRVVEHRRLARGRRRMNRGLRVLAVGLAAVVLGLVSTTGVMVSRARDEVTRERDLMSRALVLQIGEGLRRSVRDRMHPAENAATIMAEWTRRGLLQTQDPDALDPLLMGLLGGSPLVSSVVAVDLDGHEIMLLSERDGWRARNTSPDRRVQWRHYTRDGRLVATHQDEDWSDPRDRPWFRSAAAMFAPYDPSTALPMVWTDPYRLRTTGDLGISVVTVAQDPAGRRWGLAVDLTLLDVSRRTASTHLRNEGTAFLVDDDGRLLGAPARPRFEDPAEIAAAVLRPLSELELPLEAEAWRIWRERGAREGDVFVVEEQERRYWAGAFALEVRGPTPLWAFVLIPESGFVPDAQGPPPRP